MFRFRFWGGKVIFQWWKTMLAFENEGWHGIIGIFLGFISLVTTCHNQQHFHTVSNSTRGFSLPPPNKNDKQCTKIQSQHPNQPPNHLKTFKRHQAWSTIQPAQKAASWELESSCCNVDSWRMEVDDLKDRSSEKKRVSWIVYWMQWSWPNKFRFEDFKLEKKQWHDCKL